MDIILKGIKEACSLILSLDSEVFEVVLLSLEVSLVALVMAGVIAIPLGIIIAKNRFPFKNIVMRLVYTLMGLPPVLCGLLVYIFFMRRGPLGFLELNYTKEVMMIAQTLLITQIMMGLVINEATRCQEEVLNLAKTLGASKFEGFKLLLFEMKTGILLAIITGFARGISEVGAVMVVGGNIKGKTRTMTTYISELKGMGEFERAIAVGIILLVISFLINSLLYHFQRKRRYES